MKERHLHGPKGEIDQRPRRFYATAEALERPEGWSTTLDGRPLRTPEGRHLLAPTQALGRLIAEEWASQGERIDLAGMLVTRLANVALDRTPKTRDGLAAEIARYAGSDLTCYPAERPASLRLRQEEAFTPLRVWCAEELGVRLITVEGLMPAIQPPSSLEAVRRHALQLDDFRLTGLAHATPLLGSAVLALALERGRIGAEEAFSHARIDETYQQGLWGEDAEAAIMAGVRRREMIAIGAWFDALGRR